MSLNRFYYILGIFALTLLYVAFLHKDGYRLPRYYMPDGTIVDFHSQIPDGKMSRIMSIGGRDPSIVSPLLEDSNPIITTGDTGTGIMMPVPNRIVDLIFDFKYIILYSYIFLLLGIWFLEYGSDYHLAILCFSSTAFFFTLYTTLSSHQLSFFWYLSMVILIPAIVNMALRATGKNIPGFLLPAEFLFILFFALISYAGRESITTYFNMIQFARTALLLAITFATLVLLENALRRDKDRIESMKRWSLAGGVIAGVVIPLLLFFRAIPLAKPLDPFLVPSLLALIFPVSLAYGTYRIHIVPFQFTLSRSIVTALLTLSLAIVYAVALMVHSMLLPDQDQKHQWIVNIVFILFLVLFLDPTRRTLQIFVENRIFRLSAERIASLERLGNILSSPHRIPVAINEFLDEVARVLNVASVQVVLSESSFIGLNLKQNRILRLPDHSRLWKHLTRANIVVTSYLTYGGGSRGNLYRYMLQNNIYMAIGVSGSGPSRNLQSLIERVIHLIIHRGDQKKDELSLPIRSAMLIGYPVSQQRFRLQEIRYLQEAARLASMLIDNYFLLIQELEKRKRQRELVIAGDLQRLMSTGELSPVGLQIACFNLPVISVTGDYLDVIPLESGRTAIFIGDVSGHGLGTGYLVSAIRSIVRSCLEMATPLTQLLSTLNKFLLERYAGNEFATLFATIIDGHSGSMEYINAGHPYPLILATDGTPPSEISTSGGLLGVHNSVYSAISLKLSPGDRLFIFSDGITETMDERDNIFGIRRLKDFLTRQGNMDSLETLLLELQKELSLHRRNAPIQDDSTLLALQYDPGYSAYRRLKLEVTHETRSDSGMVNEIDVNDRR